VKLIKTCKTCKLQRQIRTVFGGIPKSEKQCTFAVIALTTLLFGVLFLQVIEASTTASVTLVSSGSINTDSVSSVSANPNYAYTLVSNATSNYVLSRNNTVLTSNSNPNVALNSAFTRANGTSLYINGTFRGLATFDVQYEVNTNIVFDPNSLLTIANSVNSYVFRLDYSQNCIIQNITINGNSANQVSEYYSGGAIFYDCSNCSLIHPTVTNIAGDGFECLDEGGSWTYHSPNSVINGNFTYCLWNALTIGGGGADYANGTVISGNEISHCANVAISTYNETNIIIQNNYVHDMDATSGGNEAGANCHWGLANEESPNSYYTNNTIVNCEAGIVLASGINYVAYNNVINCNTPIYINEAKNGCAYNVITHNTITNWNYHFTYWSAAIWDYYSKNNIVSFNTFVNTNATANCPTIWIYDTLNSTFVNNTITLNTLASSQGLEIDSASNYNIISGNNVQAKTGITVSSGCTGNKLSQNTLANCTTQISNSGTGTIINPTSSSTYTLTFDNPYDGSFQGTYIYSSSNQLNISLTSGVLNVDGSNVTLTSGYYTLSMSQDHYVYALGGKATINTQAG
jgi:hypothetical protein